MACCSEGCGGDTFFVLEQLQGVFVDPLHGGATHHWCWTGVGGSLVEVAAPNTFFAIPKSGLLRIAISEHVRAGFDANADPPAVLLAVCGTVIGGHRRTLSMEKNLDVWRMRLPARDDIME